MKPLFAVTIILALVSLSVPAQKSTPAVLYPGNRAPIIQEKYISLPLGSIKPAGHLLTMLKLQRDGLTGNLDSNIDFY